MTEHTPEPWRLIWWGSERYPFPLSIQSADDRYWIARDGQVSSEANARRIVAAVNACSGIPTETLEKNGVGWIHTALQDVLNASPD